VILQAGLLVLHPVAAGSRLNVIGETRECVDRITQPPTSAGCIEINYAPGGTVGIVFNVRNNGLLPMTLTRFEALGTNGAPLYELHSAISRPGAGLGSSNFAEFRPVSVPAGGEAAVALVGSFGSCEAVRHTWQPGTYGGFSTVAVNVEWGLLGIDHYVELPAEVHLRAPDAGQCP